MFPIPWFVAVLVGIPQFFLIIVLGFSLFNLRIKYNTALLVACLTAIACYFVRLYNTIDGLHTLLVTLLIMVLCIIITKIKTYKVITAILAGSVIVGGLEYSYLSLFFLVTSTTISDFAEYPWLSVVSFVPEAVILSIMYWWVKKNCFYILDGTQRNI